MKTYMFPGQGSQFKGMGGKLFGQFGELIEKADEILGYSIKELCLEDPKNELDKTQFTQPALYVVNALSYYEKIQNTPAPPDYVIGHSLGEFNALLAAGCYSFETGLKLVKKRGELMSQAPKGAMAAILNATKEQIESILEENKLFNIDLANYNTSSQIVISGSLDEISQAQTYFEDGEMLYYPINTSGAFHSRFMQTAKEMFFHYMEKFVFFDLKIPVISNVTARPYRSEDTVKNLCDQLVSCVYWVNSIEYLMVPHIYNENPMEFEEIGNGEVLTKLYCTIKDEYTNKVDSKKINKNFFKKIKTDTKNYPQNMYSMANEKVKKWNQKYPVGTRVKSTLDDFDELETRSQAMVLMEQRAAVYMKEYYGYFDLDEIIVN